MHTSDKNRQILSMLQDISQVSESLNIKTYIGGGMTIDIWEGQFLHVHDDADGFTENLIAHKDLLIEAYEKLGYQVRFLEDYSILRIDKDLVHAGFNPLLKKHRTAEWKHIGEHGSVYFPEDWLDQEPRDFYGIPIYTPSVKFEYATKTKSAMLNPEWKNPREKDLQAIQYLRSKILSEGIKEEDIYPWFWSYNPFFYEKGYNEFFRPTVAWPLDLK